MSVTIKPLNSKRSSDSVNPNSTLVEPKSSSAQSPRIGLQPKPAQSPHMNLQPKPAQPSAMPNLQPKPAAAQLAQNPKPAATPQPAEAPKPLIEYHSAAIGDLENARTKDYFAEQNQAALTKKQAHSTKIRWLLIASCGFVGVLALSLGVWWIMTQSKKPELPTTAAGYTELPEEQKIDRNTSLTQDTYVTATENSMNTGAKVDPNTINTNFDDAINNATNAVDKQTARVAKMRYLNETGNYEQMIALGEQISTDDAAADACEFPELDLGSRMTCHNLMELAYTWSETQKNPELAKYHHDRLMELMNERIEIELNRQQ